MTDRAAEGISALDIHKSFGARHVLTGVDLHVPAGTITAVLGPSGCGKTTLLRIVAGFDDADTGVVRIAGETVWGQRVSVPAHRRRVGLMPQEGALFPYLSVGDNVAFGLPRSSDTAAEVARWLDVVGLDGLVDARPHELSGGQQQRVALARALAARPRVLLLDEPFAALDSGLRVRVREDIAQILRGTGTTALLVTHDQTEALSLADSVALLIDGSIAQHGAPDDLYVRPASLDTARFIGDTVELSGEARRQTVLSAVGAHPVRLPVADGPVVIVLRPEQLRLRIDTDGAATATVTAKRFYGADSVVHMTLADGTELRVRCEGRPSVSVGQPVSVEISGDVLAYPSPTGGERMALGEPGS